MMIIPSATRMHVLGWTKLQGEKRLLGGSELNLLSHEAVSLVQRATGLSRQPYTQKFLPRQLFESKDSKAIENPLKIFTEEMC